MFSKGQLIFAILFALAFIAVLIYAYHKDLNLHKKYYKGNIWVLLAFIAFIAMIVFIKFIFVN